MIAKKLLPTLDTIQKRFFCGKDEILVWRNVLTLRYSAIQDSDLKVQITDYDSDNKPSSSFVPAFSQLPPKTVKTVVRLFHKSNKLITLTLYFTADPAGTLLCQGKLCQEWDELECEMLKSPTSSYLQNADHQQLIHTILHTNVTFLKKHLFHPSSTCS